MLYYIHDKYTLQNMTAKFVSGFALQHCSEYQQQQAARVRTAVWLLFSLSRFGNLLYKIVGFRKMKSILIFPKWTKINVQKWLAKKVLTDRFFLYCV